MTSASGFAHGTCLTQITVTCTQAEEKKSTETKGLTVLVGRQRVLEKLEEANYLRGGRDYIWKCGTPTPDSRKGQKVEEKTPLSGEKGT